MLYAALTPAEKRKSLRSQLASGGLRRFPGAFSPLVAMLIERIGFEGVYVSGAALSADLGLPDVGMTSLSEVADRGSAIARMTRLPTIVDADTGFGEPLNVARTIQTFEEAGLCGCHLEDQENPKRCGHLDRKRLVTAGEMGRKVAAAVRARRDDDFLIVARSDARADEGVRGLIDRCRRYVDAGADAIFPEALHDAAEFEAVRRAIDVPLIANMTEFGKSPLLTVAELGDLGYNVVLYPVTALRLAMAAVDRGLGTLAADGTQRGLVDAMQSRQELYDLITYHAYEEFDRDIAESSPD